MGVGYWSKKWMRSIVWQCRVKFGNLGCCWGQIGCEVLRQGRFAIVQGLGSCLFVGFVPIVRKGVGCLGILVVCRVRVSCPL